MYTRFQLFIILIISNFFILPHTVFAQEGKDSLRSQTYYYPNGKISSQGFLRDGKPDAYWKTYYENGVLKSEGNRYQYELDSIWKFYNEKGRLILDLTYKKGKKNGLKITYLDGEKTTETFVNDVKQGITSWYYPDGKLKKSIPFSDGQEDGLGREFDTTGRVITMESYKKGFITAREYVNRTDKAGLAQGKWVTFWNNGNLHTEGTYRKGQKNGYFRQYTNDGKLFKIFKYIDDVLQEDAEEIARIDERSDYYSNGVIKTKAQYKNNLPDGLWSEFSEDGTLISMLLYKKGVVTGKGITDAAGMRQGPWIEYYDDGIRKAEGKYKDGKRVGSWTFYYHSGGKEEEGKFDSRGRPDGDWKWYYEEGQLLREQSFSLGKEDGLMAEYTISGKIITRGSFIDGLEQGEWLIEYGDQRAVGNYQNGQRDGSWKFYYSNGNLSYEGRFVEDLPDGRHTYYWENGQKKDEGVFIMGRKEGDWVKYQMDGLPFLIITYKNGMEKRYDGVKIVPELRDDE